LLNQIEGLSLGIAASPKLDLNFDLNAESADNRESKQLNRTLRFAPGINWRATTKIILTANLSATVAGDSKNINQNNNVKFESQTSYRFGAGKEQARKLQGQFFLRYSNRYARVINNGIGTNNLTKLQTLNTGLSFTFF